MATKERRMPEVHVYMAEGRTDAQKKGMMHGHHQGAGRQPRLPA